MRGGAARLPAGLLALALLGGAAGAQAVPEAPARCIFLGQVGTTTFLSLARAVISENEAAIDRSLARFADLLSSYGELGCDRGALGRSFDCVLEGAEDGPPRAVARDCLAEEGLLRAGWRPAAGEARATLQGRAPGAARGPVAGVARVDGTTMARSPSQRCRAPSTRIGARALVTTRPASDLAACSH